MSDEDSTTRIRRTGAAGGAVMALAAAASVVASGIEADLPWWLVVGVAVPAAGLAGWAGSRIGRQGAVRDTALEPGERVLGTYTVRPPYTEHILPSPHEGPQYQLRVTTHGVQMWERATLLWKRPWTELRLITDGPRLRIHHQGEEAGTMLLEPPGAVQEVRLTARRHGAS
ncbi:hypothetical protein [Streptomyces sp. NPDC088178]|uniref:hypothetical protein n=1 Tax=Streptomyces sp. NPDC088178 TaxID=3365836 RepID=UPI003802207B